MSLLELIQSMEACIVHINIHQRASTMEEILNNQIEGFCLLRSYSFVCAIPRLTQWAQEHNGHSGSDGGIHVLNSIGFHFSRLI